MALGRVLLYFAFGAYFALMYWFMIGAPTP